MIQDDVDFKLKNFEVVRLYSPVYDKIGTTVYVQEYPAHGIANTCHLDKTSAFYFGILLKKGYRLWYKNISDLQYHEEGINCLLQAQKGYLCIEIKDSERAHYVEFIKHLRFDHKYKYSYRIVSEFPW